MNEHTSEVLAKQAKSPVYVMLDCFAAEFQAVRPLIVSRAGKSTYESKSDGSPVTETDAEVERAITDHVSKLFPGVSIFGEEAGYDDDALPASYWLLDPIDGTEAFIQNQPTFTSMAVLIESGIAEACIIYNHSSDELYTAVRGEGAYCNGKKLDVSAMPLPRLLYCKQKHQSDFDRIFAPVGVTTEVAPNGAGHGFSQVAAGKSAARIQIHARGYIHDYAPGALLVQEAGGVVLSLDNEPYTFRSKHFVACHPDLASYVQQYASEIGSFEPS